MEWIDINKQKPNLNDCGKDFLVAVKMASRYEYQISEWWNPEDGEREPYFNIQEGWCGQQIVNRVVTHWAELIELPSF